MSLTSMSACYIEILDDRINDHRLENEHIEKIIDNDSAVKSFENMKCYLKT